MNKTTDTSGLLRVGAFRVLCLLLVVAVSGCKQKVEEADSEEQSKAVAAQPVKTIFDMEEFSIFDCEEPLKTRLQMGQPTSECGDQPSDKVKAYPVFKSAKPIYGTVRFGMNLFDYASGIEFCFAIDESGGTGTVYDSFHFDVNHDFDLTNDPVSALMKDPPSGARVNEGRRQDTFFEQLQVALDYGPDKGKWQQTVMPRLMRFDERKYVYFIVPTARRGKIVLGSQEADAVLAQSPVITGRYDQPMTGVFLGEKSESLPFLGCWHCVDGTFYILSPTPTGDKVTVRPYDGAFGVFDVGPGDRDADVAKLELGWLQSRDTIIDIDKCPKTGGKPKVPVGDYRPFRLAIRFGQLRVGLAANISQPGKEPAKPPVFGIKIREGQPFVLDFSGKPEVVFKSPAANQRFKLGEELKAEAIIYDPVMDTLIAALEDTTKKEGSINLPDGTKYERYQSLDPTIEITNSSGDRVAQGKMPFG
jgi:hypothetical protein